MIDEEVLLTELAQVTAMERKRKQMDWSTEQFYAFSRLKKLPIFDAAHARNAMARFNQTQGMSPQDRSSAKEKITKAAGKFGIKVEGFKKLNEKIDLNDKSLVIRKATLMSQGKWNNRFYSRDEIQKAFEKTDWTVRENRNLFLEHKDAGVGDWIGEVKNPYFEDDSIKGDVVIHDVAWAAKMRSGRPHFGISPRLRGTEDAKNETVSDFLFENFSLVLNPAVKTTFLNNSEELSMEEEVNEKESEGVSEKRLKELIREELKRVALGEEKNIEPTEEVEESMDRLTDLLELCELKKLSSAEVGKKAEVLMAKDEKLSYTDAFRSAVKLQEDEEATKPEEPVPEEKPAEAPPKEEEKKEEEAAPAEKEKADEELSELRKEVKILKEQINEPATKKLSKVDTPQSVEDIDQGMMEYIEKIVDGGV